MKYIAHRGWSRLFGDNTIRSFRKAIDANFFSGIELDVQLSKDKELVIHHDLNIDSRWVKDIHSDELVHMGIVLLKDVYAEIPEIESNLVFLDIKGCDPNIVDKINKFYSSRNIDLLYICSFHREITAMMPSKYKIGTTFEMVLRPDELFDFLIGYSAVLVHWTCLDKNLIDFCKQNHIITLTYTIKSKFQDSFAQSCGVDFAITNG